MLPPRAVQCATYTIVHGGPKSLVTQIERAWEETELIGQS